MAVAYLLKMYPRFSGTFVPAEMLELERQGLDLHVYSLKKPDDGIFHADVAKLRARVTYLPESPLTHPRAYAAAQKHLATTHPRRYATALAAAIARRRGTAPPAPPDRGLLQRHRPREGHLHRRDRPRRARREAARGALRRHGQRLQPPPPRKPHGPRPARAHLQRPP